MRASSPLRYPGGKSSLLHLTMAMLRLNGLECGHYAEPFAGGCGLALSLLYGGHAAEIHINDIDPSIWSFWNSVLHDTDALIERVARTPVTIEEWHRQRDIHRSQRGSSLDLGFAAFFLNRTNRSGIIKGGGVIGGLEQTGAYKMDCRYNVDELCRRIRRVSRYSERIHLTNMDAIEFMNRSSNLPDRSMFFIDPPYFKKGRGLYTSFYKEADHKTLSETVLKLPKPWVVTYDDVPQIRQLYRSRRQFCFDIGYSLHEKRTGTELLITSKGFRVPDYARGRQVNRPQYESAA